MKVEIVLSLDNETGAFEMRGTAGDVLTLGMLEYAREMLMMKKLRPGIAGNIVLAPLVPRLPS